MTSLREQVVKIGAKVVAQGRYLVFQMCEVAVPQELFRRILDRIDRLRAPTLARCRPAPKLRRATVVCVHEPSRQARASVDGGRLAAGAPQSSLVGIQRGNVAQSVAVDLMKPNITLGALGCRLSAAMAMSAGAADDVIAARSFACENAYRLASAAAIAEAVPVIINALFAK